MGLQLRETLRRLCVEIGWSYAVFWRAVGSRNPMNLIWEDAHWERTLGISGLESMDLVLQEQGAVQNSFNDWSAKLRYPKVDRVDLLVNKLMVPQVHVLGDGIVGQAASTGSHQWILQDTLNHNVFISKGFAEMHHQFLAGIKTIAIIPVLPHGVVQLGSTQTIMENIEFVIHVRNYLFAQLGCMTGTLVCDITRKDLAQKSQLYDRIPPIASVVPPAKQTITTTTVPLSDSFQPMINPVGLSTSSLTFLEEQLLSMSSVGPREFSNNTEPALDNTKAFHLRSQECVFPNSLSDSNIVSLYGRSESLINANVLGRFKSLPDGTMESIMTHANLSSTEVPQMFNQRNHSKSTWGISGNSLLNHLSINSSHNVKDNEDSKLPYMLNERTSLFLRQTTSANDLYDVLGPDYKTNSFCGSMDDVLVHRDYANAHELATDVSTCTTQLDVCPVFDSLNNEISGTGIFSGADADQLLDVVVSKINSGAKQNSDDNLSFKTSSTKISSSSLRAGSTSCDLIASSKQMQGEPFGLSPVLVEEYAVGSGSVRSVCSLDNRTEEGSHSVGVSKSQISLWVESGQSMKCDNLSSAHSRRVDELGHLKRKRPRPGESPRRRPKDRQMIMDRVKELREIVPNGAKCSIETLLEKTIKHMLFLQSVTEHSDKLKVIGGSKIISKEGGLLLKDNFEGGATWAFEVGTQSMTCPIIVEDLIPPRHLIVKMLCEHRGFFLEIADIIRGLGLTILKGVIEARKDKVWARFAVEANRDVTRMEIFLSLVCLLEPMVASNTTLQGLDNINLPHNMFRRSCIPATGASDRLR